jgi:hypothetical protein
MKKKIILFVAMLLYVCIAEIAYSQPHPPPPPSGGHDNSGNQPSGGAPIGDGMLILIALGSAYAAKKNITMRKENSGN